MKITAFDLNVTPLGDGYTQLQQYVYDPATGNFSANAPLILEAADTAETQQVVMWCKGVEVRGTVTATDGDDSSAYPNLKGPAFSHWMGLIQIIKEQPDMTAGYEDRNGYWWTQNTIPVFDSASVAISPWYNAQTVSRLENNIPKTVSFVDLPTTTARMRYEGQQAGTRLYSMHKKLSFGIYLVVANDKFSLQYNRDDICVLSYAEWTTNSWILFRWDNPTPGNFRYKSFNFDRTSPIASHNVQTLVASRTLTNVFPNRKGSANNDIRQRTTLFPARRNIVF